MQVYVWIVVKRKFILSISSSIVGTAWEPSCKSSILTWNSSPRFVKTTLYFDNIFDCKGSILQSQTDFLLTYSHLLDLYIIIFISNRNFDTALLLPADTSYFRMRIEYLFTCIKQGRIFLLPLACSSTLPQGDIRWKFSM